MNFSLVGSKYCPRNQGYLPWLCLLLLTTFKSVCLFSAWTPDYKCLRVPGTDSYC